MVVMKMKFPFQKRVKLAQGLWLLSWSATVAGAMTFSLGCVLKTELRRRAEVFEVFVFNDISFWILSGLIANINIYITNIHNATEKMLHSSVV